MLVWWHSDDTVQVGDIQIVALSDGMSRLPPLFYSGLNIEAHPEILNEDGTAASELPRTLPDDEPRLFKLG